MLMAGPGLGVSFCSTQHRRNGPDQKNRSRDEIEEIFSKCFAWEIRRWKKKAKKKKERRCNRDGNEKSAKPATA